MKKITNTRGIILGLVSVLIIFGTYSYFNKSWQLSLYGQGKTLMRVDYKSKDACMSAGKAYIRDGTTQYERFDCGYKCDYIGDKNDLKNSPVCPVICDNYGCK